MTIIFVLNQKD